MTGICTYNTLLPRDTQSGRKVRPFFGKSLFTNNMVDDKKQKNNKKLNYKH